MTQGAPKRQDTSAQARDTEAQGGDFWSRRRAAVAAETRAEAEAITARTKAERRAEVEADAAEKSDAEILAELSLKDPDDMQQGDDFSVFLKEAVPARLRQRALRRLWRSNPVLANLDMLVEYGEDYTNSATILEGMQTTYQVGKGMLRHVEALAAAEEEAHSAADDGADDEAEVEDQADTPVVAVRPPEPMAMVEPEVAEDLDLRDDDPADEDVVLEAPAVFRRMRFDFPEDSPEQSREASV